AVKNDFYLGCATFGDELKAGIAEALTELRQLGIANAVMLSGDRAAKAELVCTELKLDQCFADLLPEQKLAQLEALMRESDGLLAYVGDGMNDAPALARADAGIAMGAIGNQSAIETADIVLLNDKPQQLVAAFRVSRQTGRVVVQNIVTALGVKILVMALGLGGVSGLWEAVIADVGVTLLVVFNSLRLLKPARSA
ncbi:MAG TPA: HAD-IC family P-type ATPase, partial [Candidatus Syntrophosphaera sp.]|nr:HAD-IC family P-type ATPase [Candidatus Syntrophosphaera sp.]